MTRILGAFLTLLFLAGCTLPDAVTSSAPAVSAASVPGSADGMWLVGTDGAANSAYPNCYWARSSDASGELSSIIANANITGPASVTVNVGEYFESQGCLPWKLA